MSKSVLLAILLTTTSLAPSWAQSSPDLATSPLPPASGAGLLSDFNATGDMSGSVLIGTTVKNAARESVGTIEDVYVSPNGSIESVVMLVGGFLGINERYILMSWTDLKFQRDRNTLVVTTTASRELLKSMPE